MTEPTTVPLTRLALIPLSAEEATSVLNGKRRAGEVWAREYPMLDELDFLRSLVFEHRAGITTGPFTHYQVRLGVDGTVIGWGTFFGPPDEFHAVEIAFGIVPDYEGHRYGAEVVAGLVGIARNNGAEFLIASIRVGDVQTQEVLLGGGLHEVVRDDLIAHFAATLRD
jgi:RimJ/RimL family protein N-acetyltransferase